MRSQFTTVLLPPEEHARDFQTIASRQAFDRLLGRAEEIIVLSDVGNRSDAYRRAGHHVIDHSDALIAYWDGEAARGPDGTADVVDYVRQRKRLLLWIHTENQPHPVLTLP